MPSCRRCCCLPSLLLLLTLSSAIRATGALDPLEPQGNISVIWDIISWTEDGYNAWITILNYQQYRHIERPGWSLGWAWNGKEILWEVWGAEATQQGDCSHIKRDHVPHSCSGTPSIVDLLPDAPYSLRTANCCRGGVLSSTVQDPLNAVANFKIKVGKAGTSKSKVVPPSHFRLGPSNLGYTCGAPHVGRASRFPAHDGRRHTQAIKTWRITCKYSATVANGSPRCCASLSAFYSQAITSCPRCSCACLPSKTCLLRNHSQPTLPSERTGEDPANSNSPLITCTSHMCPVRVHWHVKNSYTDYWKAKITITNYLLHWNHTDWNLVIQHPSYGNGVLVSNFNFTFLQNRNDSAMFWGEMNTNRWILQAGQMGSVHGDILFEKRKGEFSFNGGWAFPRRVYFNGDECVLPAPDVYPALPVKNKAPVRFFTNWVFLISVLMGIGFLRFLLYAFAFKFKDLLVPSKGFT